MNPISELYTAFMEKASPFLSRHWQLFVIAAGLVFVFGGVFNWRWTWDPTGHKPFGLHAFAYRHFGEKGARVSTAISGVVIAVCGVVLWALVGQRFFR